MEFRKTTLDNGLTVLAECNDEAHSAAVGFFVNTGSRDETADVAGVSHFLEHMVFKGTPTRSADDVNREFDEMGAHYNACTSEESTIYYAAVLPEYQNEVVELWADVMRPSLREEDFNTEKKVIIEEIRMYDDQPPFGADDKCKAAFYGSHPLANSVLGSEQSVADLPVEKMRSYFESRYSPGNIALVGSGNIDFDQLTETAERVSGKWKACETKREIQPAAAHKEFITARREAATQEYVLEFALGPAATDDARYAAKLLAVILGDDSGSRLFWDLVDPGLAEHASLSHYEFDGTGVFLTYMCCEPERCAENLQRILDVYRGALEKGVTEEELSLAKNKINSRVVLSSEKPRSRLFNVGGSWLHGRDYRTVKQSIESIRSVTSEDVSALLDKYSLSVNTTMAIGPLEEITAPQ